MFFFLYNFKNSFKYNYGNNIAKVFSIRPGVSGLWQVSGRNQLTYKRRVELDLIYVDNYPDYFFYIVLIT